MELKRPITREKAREKALNEILAELQKSYNECLDEINKSLVKRERLMLEYGAYSTADNAQSYKDEIAKLREEIHKKENKLIEIEDNINKITH